MIGYHLLVKPTRQPALLLTDYRLLITDYLSLPPGIIREYIVVFDAITGLRHHIGHCLPPAVVMFGLLMASRSIGIAIYFDQDKPVGVIALLDDVESLNPFFLNTITGIIQCNLFECFYLLGLNMNKYGSSLFHVGKPNSNLPATR